MKLWDEAQAAADVGVSAKTLARWRKAGTGPAYAQLGRKVRYRPEDVRGWLVERVQASASGLRSAS